MSSAGVAVELIFSLYVMLKYSLMLPDAMSIYAEQKVEVETCPTFQVRAITYSDFQPFVPKDSLLVTEYRIGECRVERLQHSPVTINSHNILVDLILRVSDCEFNKGDEQRIYRLPEHTSTHRAAKIPLHSHQLPTPPYFLLSMIKLLRSARWPGSE